MANAPSGASLPVVETFHSLQGEGAHAGRSAFFIRLAGCSVGCPWCDTKHSWPAGSYPQRPLSELVAEVRSAAAAGAGFVVITGGGSELLQACDELKVVVTAAADLAFGLRQGDGDGRSGAPGAKPRR